MQIFTFFYCNIANRDIIYQADYTEKYEATNYAACATISPQVLRNVRASGIERLQSYINTNGQYFEHL